MNQKKRSSWGNRRTKEVLMKMKGENVNIYIKKLSGEWEGYCRLRKGKLRIIHLVHREADTQRRSPGGLWNMQKESSSSVRVFYPKFNKEELLQKLKKNLSELSKELSISLVVLFGSYAQGNYTVASDVDLLIVYSGKKREDDFVVVKKTLDIPLLEPHVYSEDEYVSLKEVIRGMITGGVVLFSK